MAQCFCNFFAQWDINYWSKKATHSLCLCLARKAITDGPTDGLTDGTTDGYILSYMTWLTVLLFSGITHMLRSGQVNQTKLWYIFCSVSVLGDRSIWLHSCDWSSIVQFCRRVHLLKSIICWQKQKRFCPTESFLRVWSAFGPKMPADFPDSFVHWYLENEASRHPPSAEQNRSIVIK